MAIELARPAAHNTTPAVQRAIVLRAIVLDEPPLKVCGIPRSPSGPQAQW